jgi:DNA polymerase III subunit gamma/tau
MAYEVTAARKRPKLFDELAGQEFVVSTLKNSIRAERIAHAYLFSGPRGVGKTSAARILAKALNCTSGSAPTETPCGVCSNCREITSGSSLDVLEIDGASNTSVNDIRRIKDEVLFSPSSSRYKVYIIDEVHMLSNSAFNALLKTIEEPPSYVVFIFATTEIHKVPATIRSRCQQFHFQLLSLETIKNILTQTAQENDAEVEDDVLFWIAKESTGSMRDAYTLFDQVLSFSSSDSGENGAEPLRITMEMVRDTMGLVGVDTVNTLAEALSRGNSGEALTLLNDILTRGIAVEQVVIDMVDYFRTLLLIKQGITSESLLGAKPEHFSRAVVRTYSKEQLEAALELLLETYRRNRYSLSQKFELELVLCRLADLHSIVSQATLIGRITNLKDQLLRGELSPEVSDGETARTEPPAGISAAKPEPQVWQTAEKAAPVEPQEPDNVPVEITRSHIEAVQAQIKETSPSLAAALGKVTDWHYHDTVLELIFPDAYTSGRISAGLPAVADAFAAVIRTKLQLTVITAAEHEKMEQKTEGTAGKTEDETDRRLDMIKNIFRGTIVPGSGGAV